MIAVEFKKGKWEDYFNYAYNERFVFLPRFIQEEDCISNGINPEMADGFDYTTVMTKKKYKIGTKMSLTCSFEVYGAPLFMITDSLSEDENGNLWYGTGFEAVLWENGVNVFKFIKEDGKLTWKKLLSVGFNVEAGKKHEFCLEIMEDYLKITVGDSSAQLYVENLPESFFIGVTGCENINRLYNIKIEEPKD